ncbi:hypothetical protein JL720_1880 [Aureococcus anophagefferens]|nr:hypothetical protein JL720_1880 [Aureococcus anophagefferens]
MGAYIALGGDTLFAGLSDDFVAPRVAYAALTAALVAFPAVMEPANNALVVVMTGALVALLAVAAPSVDVGHLLQSAPPEELGGALASAAPVLSEEVRGYRKDDDALNAAWTFAPPLLALGRDVFLPLLSMTGGIANPFLFGLLPCLLAWRHRYDGDAEPEEILPGGGVGVSALGSGAGFLVLNAGLADAAHAVSETVAHIHL